MRRSTFGLVLAGVAAALLLGGCVENYYFSGAYGSGYYPAATCYTPSYSYAFSSYSYCPPVSCAPTYCPPTYGAPSSCAPSYGYKFGYGGYGKRCW